MPKYRIYQVSPDSRNAWLAELVNCENDERAIKLSRHSAEAGTSVEVWEGRRLVATIKMTEPA